uniref:BMP-binding endothelial regulator protein-like n=1 Tax=Styela clava TaxID=7725 RepID=UPI0019393E39|nr:BMP-binding endothelial regulator protein-like [Styela clava]
MVTFDLQDQKVQCKFRCDEEPVCAAPMNKDGECCPVCKECYYRRKTFRTSTEWIEGEKNPCERLFCRDGIITRAKLQCHTTCKDPLPPSPGQCCPSCQGCLYQGAAYREGETFQLPQDMCARCTCTNGTISCSKDPCPVLACKREDYSMREDGCCLECVGHRIQPELDGGRCRMPERILLPDEAVSEDECTRCRCKNGTLICDTKTCPISLRCPMTEWVYRPGECCPLCPEDVPRKCVDSKGRTRKHGATWQEGRDYCRNCLCVNASITCEINRCQDEPKTCPEGKTLELVPGNCCKMCIDEPGVCAVFGDPHYRTFDGRPFNYQGDCRYVIAKDCKSMNFSVVVENDAKTSRSFAWTKAVYMTLMGSGSNGETTVSLHQRLVTKVNDRKVSLPYISRAVYITMERYIVKVRTKTGVSLNWDGDSFLEIGATSAYKGLLCGLCGNYNGFPRDDFIGGDGSFKVDENSFAESWKSETGRCSRPDYSKGPSEPCSQSIMMKLEAKKKCQVFKSEDFRGCYDKVDPRDYYRSCLTDTCECPPNHKCSCESILAYTSACERKGVVVKWDRPMYCRKTCKRGKVYSQCGPACKPTCTNYKRSHTRNCSKMCVAGCHCPAGYAIHRKRCIRISQCESALRSAELRVIHRSLNSRRRRKRTQIKMKNDVFKDNPNFNAGT